MGSPRTFVVAARDGASGRLALERAVALAGQDGDRIVLAHVTRYALFRMFGEGDLRRLAPDASAHEWSRPGWLEKLAASVAGDAKPPVRVEVLEGSPGEQIAELARRESATAIVVAPHRDSVLREILVGSTTLRILRKAPCPVIIARRPTKGAYRRVDAATDVDEAGRRILDAALHLAPGAELRLLHVYRLPNEGQLRMHGMTEAEIEPLREHARDEARSGLAELQKTAPNAAIEMRYGFAGPEILAMVVKHKPDVLVVSAHRGSPMEERVLGSVTQFLLYSSPVDLVLVP